jgi:hypothetical protein
MNIEGIEFRGSKNVKGYFCLKQEIMNKRLGVLVLNLLS